MSDENQSTEEKIVRILTESGAELYQSKRDELKEDVDNAWYDIENILVRIPDSPDGHRIETCRTLESDIVKCLQIYKETCSVYNDFLKNTRSSESLEELALHEENFTRCDKLVNNELENLRQIKLSIMETLSNCRSSIISSKRQEADIQKANLQYKRREGEILREKAIIREENAKLIATNERKQAELQVELELVKQEHVAVQADICADEHVSDTHSSIDKRDFTRQYVLEQNRIRDGQGKTNAQVDNMSLKFDNISFSNRKHSSLDPYAPVFEPVRNDSMLNGLSQFLLKKDLQLSRFTQFDDKPENFYAWKTSFRSISDMLCLTPLEELDLLVKHLGHESSRFANSIRAANAHDPLSGKTQIWERLEERYGRPEMVEASLKRKLNQFSRIEPRDTKRLYELLDILCEIQSMKSDPRYSALLAYYDSSSGVTPIVNKLPFGLQEKWTFRASRYKSEKDVPYPPFWFFLSFMKEVSRTKNDPAFQFESSQKAFPKYVPKDKNVYSRKQEVDTRRNNDQISTGSDGLKRCPIHNAQHSLSKCRAFQQKTFEERKKLLREKNICFKCCESNKHIARNCSVRVKCSLCSKDHPTAMHIDKESVSGEKADGGEPAKPTEIRSNCTTLCGDKYIGKSCSKTILVDVYPAGHTGEAVRVYAIIDDQSNRTLATQELFDQLNIRGETTQYTMCSCSGRVTKYGRRTNNLRVRSVDGTTDMEMPLVTECDDIPSEMSEIPTPDVAKAYGHLQHLADKIPRLCPNSKIQLLIGRDMPEAHHVENQVTGPIGLPFAQKLSLGWVIVGEVCIGKVHSPGIVSVRKTYVLPDGRATCMEPCPLNFNLKENIIHSSVSLGKVKEKFKEDSVFLRTKDDNTVGLSVEDRQFLKLMNAEISKDEEGYWTAPLPFKNNKRTLPNNRPQALRRAQLLDNSLQKNPVKRNHFVTFMSKVLDSGAAEVAPKVSSGECWYLPLFGVYHPKKPTQLRGVFDSSAVYQGASLNSVLMSGPDMINSLLGVILRFRKESIAVSADVEQMFYRFRVCPEHRDYLRFFWYDENDPDKKLIEYRMRVHVFGNTSSPAVASFGLKKAVQNADSEVQDFVSRNFYVDDALTSKPDAAQAIELLTKTQSTLKREGNIRLHKIASNSVEVMASFPTEDLDTQVKTFAQNTESLPTQRSLGMLWNLKTDSFTFDVALEQKPFTRRCVLSIVNSIFDPVGFLAPITITGKILLRDVTPPGVDWDSPLPIEYERQWNEWRDSLKDLSKVTIPRMFTRLSFSRAKDVSIKIFSDASEKAIAAVAYLITTNEEGDSNTGFVLGKAKLAPAKGHTIPRLELCGAVLATEIAETISEQLDIPVSKVTYFTDSKVVLGYLNNTTRRFYTYVSNRVDRILSVSSSQQWRYVPTDKNPADYATRCSRSIPDINDSVWIKGSSFSKKDTPQEDSFDLLNPDRDCEIRPEIHTMKLSQSESLVPRFEKFSTWRSLVRAFTLLKKVCKPQQKDGPPVDCLAQKKDVEEFLIRLTQDSTYSEEILSCERKRPISKCSTILALNPFIDEHNVLRVGGRLGNAQCTDDKKHPVIIPRKSHVALLLVRHFHEMISHQGRLITEAAIRNHGFWIVGAKSLVSSVIHKCVFCRKLRGKFGSQLMANLPADRVTPTAPFTTVGLDVFGPWYVVARKTRGGFAENKRWAVLFTCLSSRAVHIEVIEEMSSSCFINALRRFVALRGPVREFRSDRGTNFVGAVDNIKAESICVEDGPVHKHLHESGIIWKFNPPHASHMGGVWERIIGLARRILDAMLLKSHSQRLTHEILCTFMCEVCAIINSRPIAPISTDPENPEILSPATLLTQKSEPLEGLTESVDIKEMYRSQWKHVQMLANEFWKQWREGYLQTLQVRHKWLNEQKDMEVGNVVLIRNKEEHRNNWPIGIITSVHQNTSDRKVRSVEVRVIQNGKPSSYVRPITELVLLLE